MLRAAALLPPRGVPALPMKESFSILVVAAACVSGPATSAAAVVQPTLVHRCPDIDGGLGRRVDVCRLHGSELRDVPARAANAQLAFDRPTRAYDALTRPAVAQVQMQMPMQAPAASPRRSDDEVMHRGRLALLRTLAFMVAGALVFKLLLKRSFLLGAFAGFVVELVLVGAAVLN
jgi:hypothetical protein